MNKPDAKKHNNRKGLLRLVVVAALCCALFAAAFLYGSKHGGVSSFAQKLRLIVAPPTWVDYVKKSEQAGGLVLEVGSGKVSLRTGDEAAGVGERSLWTSPSEYKVQDGFLTDLDRDGDTEMILLVWKRGRFGKHRPFWIESDEKSFSQHILIYDVGDATQEGIDGNKAEHGKGAFGLVSQKWFASDIGADVNRMKLLNEGSTTSEAVLLTEDTYGSCALWHWESFGLKTMDNEVTFVAFGDNLIHQSVYEYAYAHEGGDFDYLYEPFKEEIESADIAAFNAETVLVDKESAVSGYPLFGSPVEVGKAIAAAGFDVASCANNHALDKGIYGIDVTSSFYKDAGITCVGIQGSKEKAYRPFEIITRNGIKIALLSYTYGSNGIDISDRYPIAVHYLPGDLSQNDGAGSKKSPAFFSKDRLFADISAARDEADFVVVFAHWGDEYQTAANDYQRSIARLMAQAGADVIIGTHPHVVQETEVIERADGAGTLVYYSLGNFISGAMEGSGGAKALFTIEHCYDGARVKSWDITELY